MKRFEKRVLLSSATMHGEEQAFIKEAFDTNWVTTVGENINQLEKGVSEFVGAKGSVALASGTAALHLAIKLAGVKQGDVVFAQTLTFDATVNPVMYEKGKLVFIDSERDTWNMDPEALKKAFEKYPECKCVITVNLYGTPSKLDEIRKICDEHGAILIEDAAESLGASYKGQMTGTFGTYNSVSFNGNKIITTSGGGMMLSDDLDAVNKARKWSTQARDAAPWYQHTELGYNYRMSNIVAGIGRGQMLHLEEHIARKKEIYDRYREGLKDLPLSMNPYLDCSKPIFWLSCILIDKDAMCEHNRTDHEGTYTVVPGKSCPDHIRETLESYNVESRPIWKPMHMQPIYAENDFIKLNEDVSADIFDRGLCLPCDIKMTDEEQDIVIEIIKSCFGK
ncbi:MAG: aminotransferase class I/II-fold pyridoxal phosphate-dependent enzyme [Erysipelotrichaceae bacterium]|nr:aminotransferase class I/II-fold pyridoxal phosphate-dependent enzyme [Erysipelotrichaceae bacterium]